MKIRKQTESEYAIGDFLKKINQGKKYKNSVQLL